MSRTIEDIVSKIEKLNPLHGKRLRKNLAQFNDAYFKKAESFLQKYRDYLNTLDKDLDFGIESYLKMIADVNYETVRFMQSGEYSSTSFEEVNERVYNNPEVMQYYMHGLLLSQFLWEHHYHVLLFFIKNLANYKDDVKHYLEIGAGHGLFIMEAMNIFEKDTQFEIIDISKTSLEMSRSFINSDRIQFTLSDIFKVDKNKTYDFITMGEVLEHVEDPKSLLSKLESLLSTNGKAFVTAPANAAAIDHIYLFKNAQDIRNVIEAAHLEIIDEISLYTEDVSPEEAEKLKVSLMYGAFIKKVS